MSSDQFHLNFSLMSPGHYRGAWRCGTAGCAPVRHSAPCRRCGRS
jgi:hypothetical protein